MELRRVGASELRVSIIGLGCNNFGVRQDLEGSRRVIERALEHDITFFDTADSYGNRGGSEEILGAVLKSRRKQVVLATKFGWPMDDAGSKKGASRAYIFSAVEASLKRLRTDWIDLYQIHLPDPETPIEETLSALGDLIRQGKVRFVGCSNFEVRDLDEAQNTAERLGLPRFVSCQNHYNLLTRDIEEQLVPAMERFGMGLFPYAPLASGLLTGKYRQNAPMPKEGRIAKSPKQAERYLNDASWRAIEALTELSARRGRSLAELAMSWLLSRSPVSSVIAGAMSPEQIDQNVKSLDWKISPEDLAEIDRFTAFGRDGSNG